MLAIRRLWSIGEQRPHSRGNKTTRFRPVPEVVDCLPDRYRQVIREHFISGKRLIAIARVLKLPSATIRNSLPTRIQQLAKDPRIRELAAEVGLKL